MRHLAVVPVLMLASLPLWAQGRGLSPSMTSTGQSGVSTAPPPSVTSGVGNAPPPSVTSLGPPHVSRGTLPHNPQLFPQRPRHHHGTGAAVLPYYAPYPVYVYPDEAYTDATASAPTEPEQPPTPAPAAVPYQPRPAPAAAAAPQAPPAPEPLVQETTVLVFRDGHQMEITNYAIVGKELLNLSGKGPRRIPLADLDLPATVRVNDDRGVSFRLPNG